MIKIFQRRELQAAMDHAAAGGQALHLMEGWFANLRPDTPNCFKGRKQIAHLFDQDRTRLEAVARRLGVRVIRVERVGREGQHIDLCGKPLERAIADTKPTVCEVCELGMAAGKTLYRVNPKGVPGIWRCPSCLTSEQAERIDPELIDLANIINPPKP